MDETISNQREEPLCWAYCTARMWTRFIQNVTDEFAFTKQGNLKCNTYYDSECISKMSLFECFEHKGLANDCKKDNERLYGLLHGYLFNLLFNQFLKGGQSSIDVNIWLLHKLNDSSLFTEEHIYREFFYRSTDSELYSKRLFKRHKKYVEELIHLLNTFHTLVQKGILKMKAYFFAKWGYFEMPNTGSDETEYASLRFRLTKPIRQSDGTYTFKDEIANQLFQHFVPFPSIETSMNYLKFAIDNGCYASLTADNHMTTIVKCKEILDNENLIDLELYIKDSYGIHTFTYMGKTRHNGMFQIRFSELMNIADLNICFVFPDIEEYAGTTLSKKLFMENLKRDLHRTEMDALDKTLREKARARAEDCRSDKDCIFGKKRTCDSNTRKCYVEKCTADIDCEKNEIYKDCNKRTKKCYTSKTKQKRSIQN